LKPDGSLSQDGGPGRETKSRQTRNLLETLHCENDQTKLHRFLTTGMFYLIVKDPCRVPPERSALDQGIHSRCCASSNLLRCISAEFHIERGTTEFYAHLPRLYKFRSPVNGYFVFPITEARLQHQI
jgi:hypothetical protein